MVKMKRETREQNIGKRRERTDACNLAVPLLEQVEPVRRGGVLTERALQEKVDDSWQSNVTHV